ncbi:MAG: choice-of-anchor B family protein [Actinobacteria bacterium]|nr:choice-of-anchor B family protein [Actinomycetota bacterium]
MFARLSESRNARSLALFSIFVSLGLIWGSQLRVGAQEPDGADLANRSSFLADRKPVEDLAPLGLTRCRGGMAGAYPCKRVDLMSFLPISQIGGGANTNDLWGWTDPQTGKEYAIIGRNTGTSFVDISTPTAPVYLGNLPAHSVASLWRDVDVYNDHAFIVSEASNHGMQIFDLTQLRDVSNPPVTFSETQHYNGMSNSHTVDVNEDTGFAYAVGTNTCMGGLHIVDVRNPLRPRFAGCFQDDGYTHETQCVLYDGPDATYQGREICFAANTDSLTIVDVTNHANPSMVSRTTYAQSGYTHQGWLTEDSRLFVLDDELDELNFGHNYKTRFFNVEDLDVPFVESFFLGPIGVIDHNLYVKGQYIYESNYQGGLRILAPGPREVAFFDIYPQSNNAAFNGMWGNYPFFESGLVIASGIEQGLFVLRPNLARSPGGSW